VHVISKNIDGGATEADGGASAPVGPSVATPLCVTSTVYVILCFCILWKYAKFYKFCF